MEALTEYPNIIARVLEKYRDSYTQGQDDNVEITISQDDARGEYRLAQVGWDSSKRVCDNVFYVRIKNGKIYIEEDWTEEGVVMDFVRAGVPNQDIVLAFNPPFVRHLTDYAVS